MGFRYYFRFYIVKTVESRQKHGSIVPCQVLRQEQDLGQSSITKPSHIRRLVNNMCLEGKLLQGAFVAAEAVLP